MAPIVALFSSRAVPQVQERPEPLDETRGHAEAANRLALGSGFVGLHDPDEGIPLPLNLQRFFGRRVQ
jgi:hypothetical protein